MKKGGKVLNTFENMVRKGYLKPQNRKAQKKK